MLEHIDLLREAFLLSKKQYCYELIAVSVMPDHLHMLIKPENAKEYPKIISCIKRKFTYSINQKTSGLYRQVRSASRVKKREAGVWQRRYYEHTIRNEKELMSHIDYIHYNPVKHGYTDKAQNWNHSSFQKYIDKGWYDENWCDFSDDIVLGE